jgi:hypothetical protein
MRFNTPEEVKAWARKAAAEDYAKHAIIHTDPDGTKWQVDKNPYCTPEARNDWQRGFNNEPRREFDHPEHNLWNTYYRRGRAMAELLESMNENI